MPRPLQPGRRGPARRFGEKEQSCQHSRPPPALILDDSPEQEGERRKGRADAYILNTIVGPRNQAD